MSTNALQTLFPAIPVMDPSLKYGKIIKDTKKEFEKYAEYTKRTDTIANTTKAWEAAHSQLTVNKPLKEILKAELISKTDEYRALRDMREDVKRIISVYDQALNKCRPPTLDIATLQELEKMGFNLQKAQSQYDEIFIKYVGELNEQRQKMQDLQTRIITDLPKLKLALDTLAHYMKEGNLATPVLDLVNGWIGRAAYAKEVVDARDAELAPKPAAPIEEKKA